MNPTLAVLCGVLFGILGGGAHLLVTRWRATLAITRGALGSLLAMPLGLLGPVVAMLAAIALSRYAAWSVPLGIFAVRLVVLRRSTEDAR